MSNGRRVRDRVFAFKATEPTEFVTLTDGTRHGIVNIEDVPAGSQSRMLAIRDWARHLKVEKLDDIPAVAAVAVEGIRIMCPTMTEEQLLANYSAIRLVEMLGMCVGAYYEPDDETKEGEEGPLPDGAGSTGT